MKIIPKTFNGAAVDSLLLAFVQVITTVLGMLITKILSMEFSLENYGTYSQANLIITTVTSLSILGLTNATSYFYNRTDNKEEQRISISTIFTIQYVVGTISAFGVIIARDFFVSYFNNEGVKTIIYIAAFIPVFQNLISMLQVLYVSVGKAKIIAIRNLVISLLRLFIVIICCYYTKNLITFFVLLLIMDIGQTIYFLAGFSKTKFKIRMRKAKWELVPEILSFSIPMAIYVLTNSLSRDIDKYVISYFTDTETLAIYTNAAKILPFDLLTTSFITVLVPIITRYITTKKFKEAEFAFKAYLRFGYLATWITAFGAIIVAKELMVFLYDTKYLPGLSVFVIYLFVDIMRFANITTILAAAKKTHILMLLSIGALGANFILNIVFYKIWGLIGPAIATVLVTLCLTVSLLYFGAKEIKSKIYKLFNWKEILEIVLQLLIVGGGTFALKTILKGYIDNNFLVLCITYGIYLLIMLGMNYKRIKESLKDINYLK